MINGLLADLDKTVKIHYDNAEVKQSNVALKYSSSIQLARFRSVGLNFEYKISKFGAGGRR